LLTCILQKPDNMKSTSFILLFPLIFLSGLVHSQNFETDWENQLGGSVFNSFTDVVENKDGSFTVLGAIDKKGTAGDDLWLLIFNSSGDTLKTQVFTQEGRDRPVRMIKFEDGSLLLAAINGMSGPDQTAWVVYIGAEGEEKWRKTFPEKISVGRTDIAINNDNTWWWLNTTPDNEGPDIVKLALFNRNGETVSEYTYTDQQAMHAHSLRVLPDGSVAISGQIDLDKGSSTMWVMRINQNGEKIWTSMVPGSGKKITPECICCTPDNHIMVAGWIGSCMNPDAAPEDQIFDYDLVLSKIDGSGKILWTKNFDREGSEGGNTVAVRPDGNILIAGKCETSFTGTIGPWLILSDENGQLIQEQVDKFRFSGDQASRIINTSDGGFLMVGPGNLDQEIRRSAGWIKKFKPLLQ
jgi:hypothetical protein